MASQRFFLKERILLVVLMFSFRIYVQEGTLFAQDGSRQRSPNIILIFVDDLGYGDLTCYGRVGEPETLHTDRLARQGIRLTNAYASAPVCSSTRAGLLTGRYQQRFGYYGNFEFQLGLPISEKVIPQYLEEKGYSSALIGKWHLGENEHNHPLEFGFDEFFGFLGGQHDYFDPNEGHTWVYGAQSFAPIYQNREPVPAIDYLTTEFSSRAVEFIHRNKAQPFFLYLSYNAVHGPVQVPDSYLTSLGLGQSSSDRVLGMLTALDEGIGDVLEAVRSAGINENTLTIYASDNGAPSETRNFPLRGGKGTRYEGGARVPFILHWPGHLPAGKTLDGLAMTIDILPTILAAVGISVPNQGSHFDGRDLLPYLRGDESESPHNTLFWSMNPKSRKWAVRRGDWKLLSERNDLELYDLSRDLSEKHDLSQQQPKIRDELEKLYRDWISEMPPSIVTDENRKMKLAK
jgi:arylsulfatase A-like enzyme